MWLAEIRPRGINLGDAASDELVRHANSPHNHALCNNNCCRSCVALRDSVCYLQLERTALTQSCVRGVHLSLETWAIWHLNRCKQPRPCLYALLPADMYHQDVSYNSLQMLPGALPRGSGLIPDLIHLWSSSFLLPELHGCKPYGINLGRARLLIKTRAGFG